LFLAGDVGTQTHVMNDYVPLRVAIHCGRSNIMAVHTIVRPKLFTGKTHVGIARDGSARLGWRFLVCFGVSKQVHARADEEQKEGYCETALQHFNHMPPLLRNPWLPEKTERSCCVRHLAYPIHRRL